jgi:hypothetical protein
VSWSIALLANDALPTFTTDVGLVDEAAACIVAAPPSMPDTAAATIKVFIECFIRCHSSMIFQVQDQALMVPVGDLLPIRIWDGRKVTAFCDERCQEL